MTALKHASLVGQDLAGLVIAVSAVRSGFSYERARFVASDWDDLTARLKAEVITLSNDQPASGEPDTGGVRAVVVEGEWGDLAWRLELDGKLITDHHNRGSLQSAADRLNAALSAPVDQAKS